MNDTMKTTDATRQQPAPKPRRKSRLTTLLKVVAWTVLAFCLFVGGFLICVVNVLTPEHLTPIVTKVANNSLNADVSIGKVELSLRKSFPYLNLDVDSVVVISRSARALDAGRHAELPGWVDTVFTLDRLSGGINVAMLAVGTVDLSDVIIDRPAANLAVIDSVTTNFDIFPESNDTTSFDFASLPDIRIKKFEVTNPGPVRYYDALTRGSVTANFDAVNLIGENSPLYALHFNGDVTSPYLEPYNLDKLRFGLNGDIEWNQETPYIVGLKNFGFQLAFVKGTIDTQIDMGRNMVVNSLDVSFDPISVQEVLRIVPADIAKAWDIPSDITTTAAIEISAKLLEPFDVNTQTVPAAKVTVRVPDCNLYWHQVKLDKIHADVDMVTVVNDLDAAAININDISIAGPATNLALKGKITNIISDPLFDGEINGSTVLQNLPPILRDMVGGYISGRIEANAHVKVSPSMLSPEGYHKIRATGDFDFSDIYWVSTDTANMVYVDRACFTMGTNEMMKSRDKEHADINNLLAARITIDSISALSGDITVHASNITMGLATKNEAVSHSHDNDGEDMHIVPIGGGISVGRFHLVSISDSLTLRMRELKGNVLLKPHENDIHQPEVNFNLAYRHISAGNNSTRLMLSNGRTKIDTWRNPETEQDKLMKKTIDSIRRSSPDLEPDSVIAIAIAKHQHHRSKYPRVHPQMQSDDEEIIDWNTSRDLKMFLNKWTIKGSITSERAGVFSMYFPLHNRFKNFNIKFNNDTVKMTDIEYKVGRSDFLVSGEFTNIRRALASRDYHSPLKAVLTLESDTIDINQIAETTFKGADYSAATTRVDLSEIDNDNKLDSIIGSHVQDSDGSAPFLVPSNINATLRARSRNVLYSDLLLHNFNGEILTYRGNLNLHNLSAASDVGSVNLSALYTGAKKDDLGFSFALGLNDFNIHRFLKLMPAIDSIMPLLRDFSGIISADIAATTDITPEMDIDMPTLNAAIKLQGDSLVLLDPDTFKSLAKWLLFKDKQRNIIDSMNVSMIVKDSKLQIFPFIFDFDRYRLGVQGTNDFNLNFDYHVAVLKSPIPFKFGINLKGNPDKYKVRLGRSKFNKNVPSEYAIVDTTRINLVKEIGNVFRRGIAGARPQRLNINANPIAADIDLDTDTLTHADSLRFIQEGLIPAPDTIPTDASATDNRKSSKKSRKKNKTSSPTAQVAPQRDAAILKEMAAVEPKRITVKTTK